METIYPHFAMDPGRDFMAIDVKTANMEQAICSIGIVEVIDKVITTSYEILVQPPGNKYSHYQCMFHGMTSKDTMYEPEFPEVWKRVSPLFETYTYICAHSPSFSQDALKKSMSNYEIDANLPEFISIRDIFNRSLSDLCLGFDIPYDTKDYINSLTDATACAEIYIKHLLGIAPDLSKMSSGPKKMWDGMFNEKIDAVLFKPNPKIKEVKKNPRNIFYKKEVLITGNFDFYSRNELARKLYHELGATLVKDVGPNLDIVCLGKRFGYKKMETIINLVDQGRDILVLEEDVLEILLSSLTP